MPTLPFQPLCRPDCPGLCLDCGKWLEDLPADHHHEGEEEIDEAAVANELGLNKPEKKPEINVGGGFDFSLPLRELREELERRYFEYHISQEGQNISRVAQKVGLERTHLYRKLKQLGIQFSRRQNKSEETDKDA